MLSTSIGAVSEKSGLVCGPSDPVFCRNGYFSDGW
jgi:hypothetical protein